MKALPSLCVLLSLLSISPAAAQQSAVIDGWDKLKFGMTIDDVVKAAPEIPWNDPGRCKNPRPDLPYAYCIHTTAFEQYSVTLAGVEFEPVLTFDQYGQLVEIRLSVTERYSKAATAQSCQQDAARIADGLAARFGPLQGDGEMKTTDPAAFNIWSDANRKANAQMDKWKPSEPQLEAPALPPRSLVSALYYVSPIRGCQQSVTYLSAPLPRPIPRDTGKF